jgi:hypothetical protein
VIISKIKSMPKRKMNKKAQLPAFNIFTFMIFAVLVILVFGGWIYVTGLLNDVFTQVGVINDANPQTNYTMPCINNVSATCSGNTYVNMSIASQQTFGIMNSSIQSLRMVALVYILALACVIIVTNALMKVHPLFFFAYVLVSALAVLFAPMISNAYENVLASGLYAGGLGGFTAANWIISELPTFVMVLSLLGGIFLFVGLIKTEGGGL